MNSFDAIMVSCSALELALLVSFDLRYIRVLRVFRMSRAFLLVRLVKFTPLGSLRFMLLALIQSSGPLLWATFVLGLIMFLFAIIFLNGLTDYVSGGDSAARYVEVTKRYFGSMPMAMLTLLMSVTGGLSWWEVEHLLLEVHTIFGLIFVIFIFVTMLAAFNVITGIFVSEAIEMARRDQDVKVQSAMHENRRYIKTLKNIFSRMDENEDGTVSLDEFERKMHSEEVQELFSLLGLSIADAVSFFTLLDVNGDMSLEIDEFVMGCMRFKDKLSMVDVECSIFETKQLVAKSMARQRRMMEKISFIEEAARKNLWGSKD